MKKGTQGCGHANLNFFRYMAEVKSLGMWVNYVDLIQTWVIWEELRKCLYKTGMQASLVGFLIDVGRWQIVLSCVEKKQAEQAMESELISNILPWSLF